MEKGGNVYDFLSLSAPSLLTMSEGKHGAHDLD